MAFLIKFLTLFSLFFYQVRSISDGHANSDYNYANTDEWKSISPKCGGMKQSPINLDFYDIKQVNSECPIADYISYAEKPESLTIKNAGHTVQVNGNWSSQPTLNLKSPIISGSYRFVQFHLHWSEANRNGSEHRFLGGGYPLELHAVHLNNKYPSDAKAFKADDGIVVFGRTFEIDEGPGELDDLTAALKKIQEPGSSADLPKLPLEDFGITCNQKFITYEGSLTTPPCTENVNWLICTTPGTISQSTIKNLRQIKLNHGDTNNVRPIQPLNDRNVYYMPCYNKKKN